MRELHFKQNNPQLGKIKGVMRIFGKIIYLKFNNNQYSQQAINQLVSKGAKITLGKGWVKVDMFYNQELIILGGKEIDLTQTTDDQMELILLSFYIEQYKKAGMEVIEQNG